MEEIDWKNQIWIIPPERMKAGKEHRIPLTSGMLNILKTLKSENKKFPFESEYSKGVPISETSFRKFLKKMKVNEETTIHGFRSSFRNWAGEISPFSRETIEHALAHQLKDKSEAAYARGTLLEKRRKLMEEWEGFLLRL